MNRWLLVLPAALALATACSHPDYKGPGQIVSTEYDDPDDGITPPIIIPGGCQVVGKSTICHGPTVIPPMPWHDGPHWHVVIKGQDGKRHRISVPEQLFDGCKSGMRWTYGEGCSPG